MNSILQVLGMAGETTDRRYWVVIFLAVVDFCCVLQAVERFDKRDFLAASCWLSAGVAFSLIGYNWPAIKKRFQGHRRQPGQTNEEKINQGDHLLSYAGTESEGWFGMPSGMMYMHLVKFTNSKSSLPLTANNVKARVTYTHDDHRNFFVVSEALWRDRTPQGGNVFPLQMFIKPSALGRLVLLVEKQGTTDKYVLLSNGTVAGLSSGHWNLKVTVTSDNSATLEGVGGFTIHPDMENTLKFDEPLLTFGSMLPKSNSAR